MLKHLYIQIPCYNEALTIHEVISNIPAKIASVKKISIVVIDDGSTDDTNLIVQKFKNVEIVNLSSNRGLSIAFQRGIDFCLSKGASHIVNIDGDNQYSSDQIEVLVEKLIETNADVVIGDRKPGKLPEFSITKRLLQNCGSKITSKFCGKEILDATSGFRIYTKEAAASIFISNPFTYTLESLIQLSAYKFSIEHVVVNKNPSTRPSRLFSSNSQYVRKNGLVLLKSFIHFMPMKFFGSISIFFALLGFSSYLPYLVEMLNGNANGHLQSLMLGTLFMTSSVIFVSIAFIGDAIRANRLIIQNILINIKNIN